MRSTTCYNLYLLLLTIFNNGEETFRFCGKNFNTLGRHIWCYTAKFTEESLQVVSNHGNDIDSTIFSIETIDNSIFNINNQYKLEVPEGISNSSSKMMKNAFYFILKSFFVPKILEFLS